MKQSRTRILTECAILVALSAVLQAIPAFSMPNGGSVTLASMAPIVLAGLRFGPKWGLLTAFTGSLIQMLLGGISAPPTQTVLWFFLVILLDYILAYTVLGLAPLFAKPFKKPAVGACVGSVCVTLLRYCCHIVTGIMIWGVYAPEGQPVWLYAIVYNGSYMIPETIITAVAVSLLTVALQKAAAKGSVQV